MRQIALTVLGGLLASVLAASPSGAFTYTYKLANPSQVVAYQIGGGVITIASASLLTCQTAELTPVKSKPFVYEYKVGDPGPGMLCMNKNWAPISSYYQTGSPSTVKVHTSTGTMTVNVQPAPPTPPTLGHLPFH
jgi:hypothetical protein